MSLSTQLTELSNPGAFDKVGQLEALKGIAGAYEETAAFQSNRPFILSTLVRPIAINNELLDRRAR